MQTKFVLGEDRIPTHWYNIIPDMPGPLAPVINPQTLKPVTPDDMLAIFPMSLIEQEMSLGDMMTLLKLRRGSYALVSETLPEGARAVGLSIQQLPLPRNSIICAILRRGDVVIPRGNVTFEADDEVLALVDEASAPKLAELFGRATART